MPRKPMEIENVIKGKLGFSPARNHSADHRWYQLLIPGLPLIVTKVSHSKMDVGSKLEGKIARQLRIRKSFYELVMSCKRNGEQYRRQVTDDPFPPFDVLL